MSLDDPNRKKLVLPEHPPIPHLERGREIEAQAGAALKREYWLEDVETALGTYSRRALAYTGAGLLLSCLFLSAVIFWRISSIPSPKDLPDTDAFTVMTHVHANFAVPVKDPTFTAYLGPEDQNWRNRDAYAFAWTDENGVTQRVVVLSYGSKDDLVLDYIDRTRIFSSPDRTGSFAYGNKVDVEARSLKNYGSEWIALRLGNILMLITPSATQEDIQALQSHMTTIVASAYREAIPSATP
ncbi:MAG: hypothetical protein K8I82_27030 [Anaerolineae bacterium]|nr:hypothetical protein [Anaerolineae bacterium]